MSISLSGVVMREKKSGALQKLKKRLSHSFGRLCEYTKAGSLCESVHDVLIYI